MTDLHEALETLLMRGAILIVAGLIVWAAAVVGIGLVTTAARTVADVPALVWANENAAILAVLLTGLGYGWVRLRPVADS